MRKYLKTGADHCIEVLQRKLNFRMPHQFYQIMCKCHRWAGMQRKRENLNQLAQENTLNSSLIMKRKPYHIKVHNGKGKLLSRKYFQIVSMQMLKDRKWAK